MLKQSKFRLLKIAGGIVLLLVIVVALDDQLAVVVYNYVGGIARFAKFTRPDTVASPDMLLVNEKDSTQDTTLIAQKDIVVLEKVADLSDSLLESSGLLYAGNNTFWSHNDSYNLPVLLKVNDKGEILRTVSIHNVQNQDWEDLAEDDRGNIYIGDFGGNVSYRDTLVIYKISNPNGLLTDTAEAALIRFSYDDKKDSFPADTSRNFDMEAMCILNDTIYLFSKNYKKPYNGFTKRYWLPTTPGTYQATLIDSVLLETDFNINMDGWITSADMSPDKKNLILLSYRRLWIFSCFSGSRFFQGKVTKLNFTNFSQKEAVSFKGNGEVYITDEQMANLIGGRLFFCDLNPWLSENCVEPDSLLTLEQDTKN